MTNSVLKHIELSELRFDPQNPRLPSRLHQSDEQEIINWMLIDASLLDLIASILQNGFFEGEPLLVIKDDDGYMVVEGNRRLASLKLINNPSLASVRLASVHKLLEENRAAKKVTSVPVFVYEKREDVFNYLGYRHVTGIKSWGALHKARYVYQLSKTLTVSHEDLYRILARKIGSKSAYVKRTLIAYRVYERIELRNFFNIDGVNEESFEFSFLLDATTKYSALTSFLQIDLSSDDPLKSLNSKHLEELVRWLYEKNSENITRVGESRNIKYLAQIVANNHALVAFRAGKSLLDSAKLTDMPDEIIGSMLENALISLKEAQEYLYLSKSEDDVFSNKLKEINSLAKEMHIQIMVKKSSLDEF